MVVSYIPYTYLIGWSKLNVWYYGSEYASVKKIANPVNLWNTYFTSSKYVKEFRKQNGEPDIIEIRKTFENRKDCIDWEKKVLGKLDVVKDTKWLNCNDYVTYAHGTELYKNEKYREKMRISCSKVVHTKEWNEKVSLGLRRYKRTEQHSKNISKSLLGKSRNPLSCQKQSETLKKMCIRPPSALGKIWINDGKMRKYIQPHEAIPYGWRRGFKL